MKCYEDEMTRSRWLDLLLRDWNRDDLARGICAEGGKSEKQ